MPRRCTAVLCIALSAALGTIAGAPTSASDSSGLAVAGPAAAARVDEPLVEPFPIRRIRTTETQLSELLKQLDAGPIVRLPRAEFENRVHAAGRAAADAKVLPRITATRFQAVLQGSDLVGTAEFD